MANLTIRNIPEELMQCLRELSQSERRSLNNQIIVILEKGVEVDMHEKERSSISVEAQTKVWNALAGEWKDNRSTEETITDIMNHRTQGRKIDIER